MPKVLGGVLEGWAFSYGRGTPVVLERGRHYPALASSTAWKRLSDEVMILSRLEMVGFNPIIIRFVEEVKVMIAQLKIVEPIQGCI